MRRRAWLAAIAVAGLCSAGPAGAAAATSSGGGGVFITLFGGAGKVLSLTQIPYTASGGISVTFRGASDGACASFGDCAYSGTTTLTSASGTLLIARVQPRHHPVQDLVFLEPFASTAPASASVQRALGPGGSGQCEDVTDPEDSASELVTVNGSTATFQLLQAGGGVLTTRCAGPTDGDLAPFAPHAELPIATLLHGHQTVDLTGQPAFAVHGFTGEIDSTVVLRLGAAHRERSSSAHHQPPPGFRGHKQRLVYEQLTIVKVTGSLEAHLTGVGDPTVCGLLDSCGSSGTIAFTPTPHGAAGELTLQTPLSTPKASYLGALGVGSSAATARQTVQGGAEWTDRGVGVSSFDQAGGDCTGTTALGSGFLGLNVTDDHIAATYGVGSALRDECPGPILANDTLLSGEAPRSVIARRTFTLHLSAAPPISDDGYRISLTGGLTVTVRRGAIHAQVVTGF